MMKKQFKGMHNSSKGLLTATVAATTLFVANTVANADNVDSQVDAVKTENVDQMQPNVNPESQSSTSNISLTESLKQYVATKGPEHQANMSDQLKQQVADYGVKVANKYLGTVESADGARVEDGSWTGATEETMYPENTFDVTFKSDNYVIFQVINDNLASVYSLKPQESKNITTPEQFEQVYLDFLENPRYVNLAEEVNNTDDVQPSVSAAQISKSSIQGKYVVLSSKANVMNEKKVDINAKEVNVKGNAAKLSEAVLPQTGSDNNQASIMSLSGVAFVLGTMGLVPGFKKRV